MSNSENLQPALRQRASELLWRLSPEERESLLIGCWMSHDARWFMAVAREFGMEATNRINREVIRDTGKFEARRILRGLKLLPVRTIEECLLAQEAIIGLFGPDLLEYDMRKVGDGAYELHVGRCFAYENVTQAGIGDQFECGIFARSSGWFEAMRVAFEMTPPLGRCMKVDGQECIHTFNFRVNSDG